jgi:pyruvate-formate lyase-activating enzyme
MKSFKRDIVAEFKPTVEEIADIICDMDSVEQANLLNYIADNVSEWTKPYVFQLEYITDENLSLKARSLMSNIGNYAYHNIENSEGGIHENSL